MGRPTQAFRLCHAFDQPMAAQMLATDPKFAEEFQKKLATDAAFRGSPEARLRFFYERSPYFDPQFLLYPIAREQ